MELVRYLRVRWNKIFHRKAMNAILRELNYKDGDTQAILEYPGIALLASDVAGYFDKIGGPNWVEFTMLDSASMRLFVVTIQRKNGETPAQKIKRLEDEIKRIVQKE